MKVKQKCMAHRTSGHASSPAAMPAQSTTVYVSAGFLPGSLPDRRSLANTFLFRSVGWILLAVVSIACSTSGKEQGAGDLPIGLGGSDVSTGGDQGRINPDLGVGGDETGTEVTETTEVTAGDMVEINPQEVVTDLDGGCLPACDGKECGDDGCGGSCGECQGCDGPDAGLCADGVCDQICCPDCEEKVCGDDGCGGICGDCGLNAECTGEWKCQCLFSQCGDGCCPEGALCFEDACCASNCDGKQCGPDGCGAECGTCVIGDVCLEEQTCCTPDCDGKTCGFDGCGGTCGECLPDGVCLLDQCCYPDCDGKPCGDDGCGSQCGFCSPIEFCIEGQCLPDPQFIGCSDGTREGFLALGGYPLLAACSGAWDVPGIHNTVPACNREGGNTGSNAMGVGCNVTDLCAEGWHVCLGRNDVDYRSPLGCLEIMKGAESPAFFLVRTSSTGAMNCAPDTIGEPSSINDLFGCGDLGCPANAASCEPLTQASHDLCKSIKNKPTSSCACFFPGELDPGDPKYVAGDFENVFCTPNSGGCGWCKPVDYWNKKLGLTQGNAWDCGSNSTQEAINVTKSDSHIQGGVLCCKDQCEIDADCDDGMVCIMSTCQL